MMEIIILLQETAGSFVNTPNEGFTEHTIINSVQWLKLFIEATGAVIIGIGVLKSIFDFIRALLPPQVENYNRIRLTLARYLALALEFQLGADILSTAVAPSWDQIGKLGAIAIIRTALNYFLTREMEQERNVTENNDSDTELPSENATSNK